MLRGYYGSGGTMVVLMSMAPTLGLLPWDLTPLRYTTPPLPIDIRRIHVCRAWKYELIVWILLKMKKSLNHCYLLILAWLLNLQGIRIFSIDLQIKTFWSEVFFGTILGPILKKLLNNLWNILKTNFETIYEIIFSRDSNLTLLW